MKFNLVKSIISIATSGLIAYSFYSFHSGENRNILVIGSFISLSITLIFSIAISFNLLRTTTLIRTVSILFFLIVLISNLIFHFVNFQQEAYIIVNGILFLTYIFITYSLFKVKQ